MTRQRPSQLWPDVTCPAARRVLTYLFNSTATYTDPDFEYRVDELIIRSGLAGASRLWRRIQDTDIARQLAGGPGLLPEITDAVKGVDSIIYRLRRPRNLEQQVAEIVLNLEWYIDPVNAEPVSYAGPANKLGITGLVFCIAMVAFAVFSDFARDHPNFAPSVLMMFSAILLALSGFSTTVASARDTDTPDGNGDRRGKLVYSTFTARATVLYHYLVREFSEQE